MTESASEMRAKTPEAPPVQGGGSDATPDRPFRIIGETSYLWYEPGSSTLVVPFDNLATLDHPYPRQPWVARHLRQMGCAMLGVQSQRKDWFRGTDVPELLTTLRERGFFVGFERIVFVGASMGGFGALNYAPLVPGATVLALSPQSTMNQRIAPFENRFPWAVRNSDWNHPRFLDAADAIPDIPRATIVYDPFEYEDKTHATRLSGPNVQLAPVPHSTHEAVRTVMKSGAFEVMLREFIETGRLGAAFRKAMRGRRKARKWARAFVDNLAATHHTRLALRAYDQLIASENYLFAMQARRELLEARPELREH